MPSSSPILVVPAERLDALGRFQGFEPDVDRYLSALFAEGIPRFLPRDAMETDPSFKQIIPYVIFACGDRVFRYTRGKSQGEARLHAKLSIGVGGHVDEADAEGRTSLEAYEMALLRELDEEVAIGSTGRLRRIGLINDDETPVGRVHLGVIHLYELDSPDVSPREEGLADARFVSFDELEVDRGRLESWSGIALDALKSLGLKAIGGSVGPGGPP